MLYTLAMEISFSLPDQVLPFLKNKADGYYLAGGTALSMFYYQHRESFDLDFFTQTFSSEQVLKISRNLEKDSGWQVELLSEQNRENLIRVAIYLVHIGDEKKCKIDFVEDYVPLIHPLKRVDGVDILSLEDIYLRKIYAIAGHVPALNEIGQKVMLGGRQVAKDFYDIYCLSTITMPLSEFVSRHCNNAVQEGVVRWYRTYDRTDMKLGLLGLVTANEPDFRLIEAHFKKEIDKLLETLIGG
ncbi:MAG: hypothetical protein A3D10_00120 [Omnitrophica WOR_2 bacterium RIFCSPHIGHO2_02_FULL_48_11]|nr:MAG: hypothetical protein A3D10_00120 [Omnitrophica WOR_2 bacterium RIFCSPHIGHO2_02_FULL_48_11]